MTCIEYQQDVSTFVDGELQDQSTSEMFLHLSSCTGCRDFFRATQMVRHAILHTAPVPFPASLDDRVHAIMGPDLAQGKSSRLPFASLWKWRFTIPVPAIAMILVVALATAAAAMFGWLRTTPAEEPKVIVYMSIEPIEVYASDDLQKEPNNERINR